jgi:hypothetical protein
MFDAREIKSFRALNDHVIVTNMNFDQRITSSGIILMGDDSRSEGIRPRWAKIWSVGPDQTEFSIGQWILVAHGRWTRGSRIKIGAEELVVRRVDVADILAVSDSQPIDDTISDAVSVAPGQ